MKSTFIGYFRTSLYNGPRIRTTVPTEDRFLIQASEFTAVERNLLGNFTVICEGTMIVCQWSLQNNHKSNNLKHLPIT